MSVNESRHRMLGEAPVGRLLLKFSFPAIVGMMVMALYNIVDRIFLGMVSADAIASVYVTFPIALLIMAIDMGIGIGGASLASIRLGEGRRSEANRILCHAFWLLLLFSLVTAVGMWLALEPMLRLFGASETLLPMAAAYQKIIILGCPLQILGFGLNNFIRSDGNPTAAMATMLIGAVVNTVLDYLFIIRLGWGVEGAALATIIGQGLSFLWVMSYFFSGRSLLRLYVRGISFDIALVKQILMLGIPSFGMQLAASLVMTIFNHELNFWGGDTAVAAMGVVQSLSTLCFLPIFGINQGTQPILGYNFGAKKFRRVKETLRTGILSGTVYMCLFFAVVMIFPDELIRLFVSEPEAYARLHDVVFEGLRLYFITLPILAYPIIGGVFFQATGKALIATFLSLNRQLIILIPSVHILANIWGMTGIWMAYPVSDVLSTIVTAFFLVRALRTLPD